MVIPRDLVSPPADLQALGIVAIDLLPPDEVRFVWLGGIDHTALIVRREPTGGHSLVGEYNDETTRQLWPPPR